MTPTKNWITSQRSVTRLMDLEKIKTTNAWSTTKNQSNNCFHSMRTKKTMNAWSPTWSPSIHCFHSSVKLKSRMNLNLEIGQEEEFSHSSVQLQIFWYEIFQVCITGRFERAVEVFQHSSHNHLIFMFC